MKLEVQEWSVEIYTCLIRKMSIKIRYSGQVSIGTFNSSFLEWFMELMDPVAVQTVGWKSGLVGSPSGVTKEITANN